MKTPNKWNLYSNAFYRGKCVRIVKNTFDDDTKMVRIQLENDGPTYPVHTHTLNNPVL